MAGPELSAEQEAQLARYAALVRTGPHGLVSRRDLERIDDHVADALTGVQAVRDSGAERLVDVGSGAGLPGIPLAVACPSAQQVLLVESQGWKAAFLTECAAALGLADRVSVHADRAETVAASVRERADVAVTRALAAPPVAAEYLAPFVRPGGALVLWSTSAQAAAPGLDVVGEQLGLGAPEVVPAASPLRADGVLLVWPKHAPTPARFPRRVGVAARRPLAGG